MGRVFLAESPGGQLAAVKVILPESRKDPIHRQWFSREADALRRVSGKSVPEVLDADAGADLPWLATAYIPGPTLGDAVREYGPMPVSWIVALASGLAEALLAIHLAGLVHRDLKPRNVILAEGGPRLIDFGVVAVGQSVPDPLLEEGVVVGTPGFIAPEVFEGEPAGTSSDVFSLGAVLATAATGSPPFGMGLAPAIILRTLQESPALSGMPALIRPLVTRCLAKERADRPSVPEVLAYTDGLGMGLFGLERGAFSALTAGTAAGHGWSASGGAPQPLAGPASSPSGSIVVPPRPVPPPQVAVAEYEVTDFFRAAKPVSGPSGPSGPSSAPAPNFAPGSNYPTPSPAPGSGRQGTAASYGAGTREPGPATGAEANPPATYQPIPAPVTAHAPAPAPPPPSAFPAAPAASPGRREGASKGLRKAFGGARQRRRESAGAVPGGWSGTGGNIPQGESGGPSEHQPRYMTGIMSERAEPGSRISLLVLIALAPQESPSAPLKSFAVPRTGQTVTVTVSVQGLVPNGDLEQELFVPFSADSEPVRFGFTAGRIGLHPVMVRAFSGGTFLGELLLQVSVEPGSTMESPRRRTSAVGGLAAEPGEVTLQVSRTDDDRYSFQLIGEALYRVEMTKRLAGDPAQLVASIAEELRAMSAQSSPFSSPALIRRRIKNLGAQLWSDVVPQEIRRQFWEQGDRIKLFTIASDMDTVPWELLYPVDDVNDKGFLVEQFPVVRRVYGQGRARRLPLSSAAYIVPPRSPANAMDEVSGVRGILPSTVRDQGVCASLEGLIQLLENAPSVLHFACHNAFAEKSGSVISLDGGQLRPSDLAVAVQQSGLAAASPLVFFNACRTAGEVQGLVQMMGWAKQFMGAGASAFIGSLWAVRSPTAKAFAQEFYRALITDQLPLGTASLQARRAISGDAGDPTWLAYTVYGNPSASVTDALQS